LKLIKARTLIKGVGEGEALVSTKPISFYGGVDPKRGIVVEKGHPLEGVSLKGRVLFFPYGKGSTVSSYVIYELARRGFAPRAIVNLESELIIIAGCALASIPLVDKPSPNPFNLVKDGDYVKVVAIGKVAKVLIGG